MSPVRPDVRVIGFALDPDHYRLRDHLIRAAQPFEWLEADSPEAQALLVERGLVDPELPVVFYVDDVYRRDIRDPGRAVAAAGRPDPFALRPGDRGWPGGRVSPQPSTQPRMSSRPWFSSVTSPAAKLRTRP